MNKQEYNEMREEFASLVYQYERYLKVGFLTDCRYNALFFDELKKLRRAEAEIALISQAIQAKENNKIDVILNAIDKTKAEFKKELVQTENKHNYCVQLLSIVDKFDKSVFDLSEKYFRDFIFTHHPVVNLNAKKEAKDIYELLKRFYFECNYLGFKEFLNSNIKVFECDEVTEEKYVEASQVYFQFRNTINNTLNELSKKYPYNKNDIFNDEMTVQAEKDDIEIQAKKMTEALKNARKDFFDAFGFEIKLVDEE